MNKREIVKTINSVDVLEAMHIIMMRLNDERAYNKWVQVVPDEPTEDDFWDIVWDEELRKEAEKTFVDAIKEYGKDGICWRVFKDA